MSAPKSPLVAVLGSINLDITVAVDELPHPGQTVLGRQAVRGLGGKGANQAAATAQLLGQCRMLGSVGKDPDGDWLLENLAGFGVDVSSVRRDKHHASGLALIGVDQHAENSIIVAPGANSHVVATPTDTADADALMLQFEIPLETVVRAAQDFRGFVAINPSPSRPIPADLLRRADLFVVNAEEYEHMPELCDAKLVAVTRGPQGAELRELDRVIDTVKATPRGTSGEHRRSRRRVLRWPHLCPHPGRPAPRRARGRVQRRRHGGRRRRLPATLEGAWSLPRHIDFITAGKGSPVLRVVSHVGAFELGPRPGGR